MMHVDFTDGNSEKPHEIRLRMGDFYRLPNIPKMIARLGQVFTQCKVIETNSHLGNINLLRSAISNADPSLRSGNRIGFHGRNELSRQGQSFSIIIRNMD